MTDERKQPEEAIMSVNTTSSTKDKNAATSMARPSNKRRASARTPRTGDSRQVLLSFARLGLLGTRW